VVPLNSGEKLTWPILGKQPHSSQVDLKVQAFLNLTLKTNKVFIYLPELDIVNGIKEELFVGEIAENNRKLRK